MLGAPWLVAGGSCILCILADPHHGHRSRHIGSPTTVPSGIAPSHSPGGAGVRSKTIKHPSHWNRKGVMVELWPGRTGRSNKKPTLQVVAGGYTLPSRQKGETWLLPAASYNSTLIPLPGSTSRT